MGVCSMPIYSHDKYKGTYRTIKKTPAVVYLAVLRDEYEYKSFLQKHENYNEILFVKRGTGSVEIEKKKYEIRAGDIIIYNKNTLHQEFFTSSPDSLIIYVFAFTISLEGVKEGDVLDAGIPPVMPSGEYESLFQKYCELMIEETSSYNLGYEIVTSNLVSSMVMIILRIINEKYDVFHLKEATGLGYEIKKYIEINFNRKLSLDDISNHFHYSPFYLSLCFRNDIGDSPINYLIKYRIEEAKKLLITTDFSVQRISEKVGYDNSSYFSMIFKQHTNSSPGKFRELFDERK